jgi:hypothetical protein
MEMTKLTVAALVVGGARRAIAPTLVRVRGGAVSIDGFTHARDSALTGILMV